MALFTISVHLLIFVIFCCLCVVEPRGGPKGEYSAEWIVKARYGRSSVENLAERLSYDVVDETFNRKRCLFSREAGKLLENGIRNVCYTSEGPGSKTVELEENLPLLRSLQLDSVDQLRYLRREPRTRVVGHINDSHWGSMWHVQQDQFPSMGVYAAWLQGYSGAGVHVGVLDDGVEPDHPDLASNLDETLSFNFLMDEAFVNHTEDDFHGTWCAGIVSAAKNDFCVLGIAYSSTFGAVKIFDKYYGLTDYGEYLALTFQLPHTDVYSNSWGPLDNGEIFEGPGAFAREALKTAALEGRNGLGAVYTWAAGNGGIRDDCNCDGYANSIYTIAVTSIGRDQAITWYSEECSNIMAGTYSGDSPDLRIATTDTGGSCTDIFQGTSASCPMGAGIVALALEANPLLSWRDVQHLIVETSTRDGLINANWQTNGAGFRVSHAFGFGILNAEAMIDAALTWKSVGEQHQCNGPVIIANSTSVNGVYIVSRHETDGCQGHVQYLEHVEVWIHFRSTVRGAIQIVLTSPSGTRSRLLRPRQLDEYNGTTEWTFMTVQCWGERPRGTWTLQLETSNSAADFGLDGWQLIMYGTQAAPAHYPAAPVTQEPTCDDDNVEVIVGGAIGGAALCVLVMTLVYILVIKKAKDVTVYPVITNQHYQNGK